MRSLAGDLFPGTAIVIGAWVVVILIANVGSPVNPLGVRIVVPVTVGRQDGVILLAGILHRIDRILTVQRLQLTGIVTAGGRQPGTQRRRAKRLGSKKLGIPIVAVRFLERVHSKKIAPRPVVDAEIADTELVIHPEKGATGRCFHHLHAGMVIGPPVGVVAHFLGVGTGRPRTINAVRRLRVTGSVRADDLAQHDTRNIALGEIVNV